MSEWDAMKTLLSTDSELASRIVDTSVDRESKPVRGTYLVLFRAGPDSMDDGRYGSVTVGSSDAVYEFPLRAVAEIPELVENLAARVKALVGKKPTITGRRCSPISVEFGQVKSDTSVAPPLYFMDMWASFESRRG